MKKFDGWWLPDHEAHLQDWMNTVGDRRHGRLAYQGRKYDMAMRYVKQRRRAIDVGAHVGLWSFLMAHDFQTVEAFEPMPEHRECFDHNLSDAAHIILIHPCALGADSDTVHIRTRTADSSGDTGVEPDGDGVKVPLAMLDSFGFTDVDFIKIDCEGYELFVCQGARETLLRCKPCVIVEQKPETGGAARYGIGETDAVTFLESLGARRREALQGDYVLSWD